MHRMLLIFAITLILKLQDAIAASPHARDYHHHRIRQTPNTGSCGSVEIQFANGLDGRTEPAFQPVNQIDFSHGSSKQIDQIADFICQRLRSPCNAPQATLDKCAVAQAAVSSQGGGAAADNWNAAFGISTNFAGGVVAPNRNSVAPTATAQIQQQPQQQSTTPQAQSSQQTQAFGVGSIANKPDNNPSTNANVDGNTISGNSQAAVRTTIQTEAGQVQPSTPASQSVTTVSNGQSTQFTPTVPAPSAVGPDNAEDHLNDPGCILQAILVTVTLPAGAQATGSYTPPVPLAGFSSLDLGRCTDPSINFGAGLGGRSINQYAFMNNNPSQFKHGSALEINTITQFTCDNLVNVCGLSTDSPTVGACNSAQSSAQAKGNTGAAADVFNHAMGFSTYFAAVDGSGS